MAPNKEPLPEVTPEELPGFPLTKEFLEFSFNKKVDTFVVTTGTNPGDNFLSIMFAIEVIFKGESETNYYLIKCYPNNPGRRQFLDEMNVFEKELFMYEDLFPLLQKMAKESGADEDVIELALPPYHGGNVVIAPSKKFKGTIWENENFIIMTDLRKEKYTMADRTAGLDLEHAKLVLKEMAKLHALGWAYKEKTGLDMLSTKYPKLLDEMYTNDKLQDQFKALMDQITGNALSVIKDALKEDHPAYLNFKRRADIEMEDIMKKFMRPQGRDEQEFEDMLRVKPNDKKGYHKEQWLTGTHGDCWVNNMLFKYENPDSPTHPLGVTFVDFQIYREACPTVDIAYFFSSSIRAEIRIPHKNELLETYYSAFLMYCHELGVKPFPGFSFTSLKRRFRRAELFGLFVGLPLLTVVLKPREEAIDLDKEGGKDAVEMFSKVVSGSEKNTKFQSEMVASVLDLYGMGVL